MKLSLVFAIFAFAPINADAAPTAKSKKADAAKVVQMVTITGACTKLVHIGQPVDGCKKTLVNMNYSIGVSAYWFMAERTILSFSGDGTHRIDRVPAPSFRRSTGSFWVPRMVPMMRLGSALRWASVVLAIQLRKVHCSNAWLILRQASRRVSSEPMDVRQGLMSFLSPSMSETICSLIVSPALWQCYPLMVFGIWSSGEH